MLLHVMCHHIWYIYWSAFLASGDQRFSGMCEFMGTCGFAVSALWLQSSSSWDSFWLEVWCTDVA